MTDLPVIGVPIRTSDLGGLDSLLSMVQMPSGVPVATVAINGARNAAILAAKILRVAGLAPGPRGRAERPRDAEGGAAMIERYSTPEMAAIWTDEARMAAWLEVELAVCEAWAQLGQDPRGRHGRDQGEGQLRRRAGERDRGGHPARRDRLRELRGRERRGVLQVHPLRAHLVRRARHRAGPAVAGGRGAAGGRDHAAGPDPAAAGRSSTATRS